VIWHGEIQDFSGNSFAQSWLLAVKGWDFPWCEWEIWRLGGCLKSAEQKDGVERARNFSNGGIHTLREMEGGTLVLGGPRRRYGERNVQTSRIGWRQHGH